MKFAEENYARELHRQLVETFQITHGVSVSLNGSGCHWNCIAANGQRKCVIHCFALPKGKGPEYLILFEIGDQEQATARTASESDVLAAVKRWQDEADLNQMYAHFPFVDQRKRELEDIIEIALAMCPKLKSVGREMKYKTSGLYELWFRENNRSCQIYHYGKNANPDAIFHWDECLIFQYQASDFKELARVLERWIFDQVMPSALRKEFPWLEMKTVAQYYEKGRGIEGEFVQSWDDMEKFYQQEMAFLDWLPVPGILEFVTELRRHGYDHSLRAGQSMHTLILSRSRRNGLQRGQPRISFDFRKNGMNIRAETKNLKELALGEIKFNNEVRILLDELAAEAIT